MLIVWNFFLRAHPPFRAACSVSIPECKISPSRRVRLWCTRMHTAPSSLFARSTRPRGPRNVARLPARLDDFRFAVCLSSPPESLLVACFGSPRSMDFFSSAQKLMKTLSSFMKKFQKRLFLRIRPKVAVLYISTNLLQVRGSPSSPD